jgi:hypothetical protein
MAGSPGPLVPQATAVFLRISVLSANAFNQDMAPDAA